MCSRNVLPPLASSHDVLAAGHLCGVHCVASKQDPADCESIQLISGLALEAGAERLVLAYNVNDCESKMGFFEVERVWRTLVPLPGSRLF